MQVEYMFVYTAALQVSSNNASNMSWHLLNMFPLKVAKARGPFFSLMEPRVILEMCSRSAP